MISGILLLSVMSAQLKTWTSVPAEPGTETTSLDSRYGYDPRTDGERCPLCDGTFVLFDEETALEPTCAVFVCAHHFLVDGDCPGTRLKVYDDGFVSRSANFSH